ncbi:MAG: polyprenyl synthetase family protein [Bacillota bacterium]|nr:polyprenyl synthetase family protein [Bacillota bacterium]
MYNEEYYRLKNIADRDLLKYLPEEEEKSRSVLEAMKYSLSAGGKRVRPVLMLAACSLAGGNEEDAVPFACAIEYIHTYSLIHDDLPAMDDDDLRRGKPTNHVVFGEACAVLAGDALLNRAFEVMFEALINGDEKNRNRYLKAARCISEASGYYGMVGGQIADIEGETSGKKDMDHLKFIHKRKTGALIKAAIIAGAHIGGGDEKLISDLSELGELMGLEFQIADDILDVCGDSSELGKPVGSDDKNGKLTYPSCVGMEKTREIYEDVHRRTMELIEKLGPEAKFFKDFAGDLYYRIN